MRHLFLACTFATTALLAPLSAQTTTLTFDGASGWVSLATDYGDRVTGATMGGYSYGGSGSFTPNVVAAFGGERPPNEHPAYMYPWATGYNDLVNVAALGSNFGGELQIALTADPGYAVSIDAFDLGNFGPALTLPYVRVTDASGAVLFEELNAPLNANTSNAERSYVLSPPPTGPVLTLRVGLHGLGYNSDNVGIDNLTFTQRTVTPIDIGTRYCTSNPNVTGGSATIRAWGSSVAAQNDLTFVATGLPIHTFGYFIASRTQGFTPNPLGSAGVLCLGGAIGRFVGPGQVMRSRGFGYFILEVDLAQMPTPTGFVQVVSGETWNFQAWYRDSQAGIPASNFTDGVSIDFQ